MRLEASLKGNNTNSPMDPSQALRTSSRDKLRVLGQALIEILLNFSIEFSFKVIILIITIIYI